jgi:hypothetical protein
MAYSIGPGVAQAISDNGDEPRSRLLSTSSGVVLVLVGAIAGRAPAAVLLNLVRMSS